MKQENTCSSSAQSKSAPATTAAASIPAALHYKCRYCSRQFKSSRARCSHQRTHRMASEIRMKPYGAVLGAVLIHHHSPSDDEDEANNGPSPDEPALEAAPKKGMGTSQIPAKLSQTEIRIKGKEPAVIIAKEKARAPSAKPEAKTRTTAGYCHPRGPQKKLTKDLLGEWNPMCIDRSEVEGSGSSWELTQDLPAARVLAEMGYDDLDLELKLCSMNNSKVVDLELKLGF